MRVKDFMLTRKEKKGQTWSFDLIVAVILFVVVIALFYAFLTEDKNEDRTEFLEDGAQVIQSSLSCDLTTNNSFCIIQGNELRDDDRIENLSNLPYDVLKSQLGVPGDFCVFVKDRRGNLVPLQRPGSADEVAGLGNSDLLLHEGGAATYYCGDVIT